MSTVPKWKKFEHIIAEIQKQITPDAEVTHNYTFVDDDGKKWQVDVLIEQPMGLLTCRTIIECKDYKRRVSREKIDGFPIKMREVKANAGIVMSVSGFSDSARAFAESYNFKLMEYREAEQADWDDLLGQEAWITLVRLNRIDNLSFSVGLEDSRDFPVPHNLALFNRDYHELGPIKDRIDKDIIIPHLMKSSSLVMWPDIKIETEVAGVFIRDTTSNLFVPVRMMRMVGDLIHELFIVNLRLAEGKVIIDSETNEKKYIQLVSDFFNWKELFESQQGKILSKEEFMELRKRGGEVFTLDMPYLRVVLTKKPE